MTNCARHFTFADKLCLGIDQTLRTLGNRPQTTPRKNPADIIKDQPLSEKDRAHSAGLMRVNHAGEVCAQALYQGQALTARTDAVREQMQHASFEENDHLAWCQQRLTELGSHTSYLNILWYFGSLSIGILAGIAGDKWSLGFLAETENQVVTHLNGHLNKLPDADRKSLAILEQMLTDEHQHEKTALDAGGKALPEFIKKLMQLTSGIMTTLAYKI